MFIEQLISLLDTKKLSNDAESFDHRNTLYI